VSQVGKEEENKFVELKLGFDCVAAEEIEEKDEAGKKEVNSPQSRALGVICISLLIGVDLHYYSRE
jgi:hypothetical protein